MRRLKLHRCLLAGAASLLMSMPALAKDRTPEPEGIVTNGFVLHPGADLSFGVDSYKADTVGTSVDGLVDIGVHFNTHLQNDEKYDWDNRISFNWRQFWGLGILNSTDGGPQVTVSSSADLFKKSLFRLKPELTYHYTSSAEDSNLNTLPDNHTFSIGTYGTFQPGEGAIFFERLGYHFSYKYFPDSSSLSFMEHRIESLTQWSFLPQTHMALLVDFRVVHYTNAQRETSYLYDNSSRENPFGLPLRIKYSLGGLITTRLTYDLGAGYAYIKYNPADAVHSWVMNAKLRFDFTNNIGLQLEYKKDFENAAYGDFYNFHRVQLGFDAIWFNALQTEASIGYGYYMYSVDAIDSARNDHLITANLDVYYSFFPGLRLGINYKLRDDISDINTAGYIKHSASLNLSYEY